MPCFINFENGYSNGPQLPPASCWQTTVHDALLLAVIVLQARPAKSLRLKPDQTRTETEPV